MTVEIKTIRSDIPGHVSRPRADLPVAGPARHENAQALQARRLLVGRGITLSGQVNDCENLIVEGKLVADGMAVTQLDVVEGGVCTGTLRADKATIAGKFEGRLVVTGTLKLTATAVVSGEIVYATMTVEDGAALDARLQKYAPEEAAKPTNVEKLFGENGEARGAGSQ